MEVHLKGIPEFLGQDALHKRLEPIMATLGIGTADFSTDKPRKSKWANCCFLQRKYSMQSPQSSQKKATKTSQAKHAKLFLQKHGEKWVPIKSSSRTSAKGSVNGSVNGSVKNAASPQTRRKARLQLMGNDVYCTPSKRAPEPVTIRALQYTTEEMRNPTRKVERDGSTETLGLRALSCGLNYFHEDQLAFSRELEYRDITDAVAKFSKRLLLIKWQQGGFLATQKIMRISLDTVVSLIYSRPDLLTLTLSEEPSFFEQDPDLPVAFSFLRLNNAGSRPAEPTRTRICHLDQKHAKVVGHCLVYQLELSETDLRRKIAALECHPVIHSFVRYDLLTPRTAPGPTHIESSETAMGNLMDQLNRYTRTAELPFDMMYQLQSLAWNAYLHPRTVSALAEKLRHVYRLDKLNGTRQISVDALKRLKNTAWPQPYGDPSEFNADSIIQHLKEQDKKIRKDSAMRRGLSSPTHNLALIYRVTVTPSRITLHGPELEAKNRILRKFPQHHGFFARVQFTDENGSNLILNGRINYSQIYQRYKYVLDNGIQLAGRRYTFLGFSSSSLRSHSVWFSAPFVDHDGRHQSYQVIMNELGDFSHIRCPARCAARIGQAFSETPFSISLEELDIVRNIPDVTSSDGSRMFSDGVGTISQQLVYRIWEEIPQSKAAPTAFQIRYQGAKGMLALDSRLLDSSISLRPSMVKFASREKRVLEICDMASKPIPLCLNRQMIKILEDMGVEDAWFLEMQEIALSRLRAVTESTYNVAHFLKQQNIGEGIRFHRFIRQLENMGLDYTKEAFLNAVVEASLLREVRLLKHKARIPISDGVTLFGIMDETGYLKDGQVFIHFDTTSGCFKPPPTNGQLVFVTRSPALHPGDVQQAWVRVPPEGHPLRMHMNVLVFSQHGSRDLPSKLGGGDVDGDTYSILYDPGAMPLRVFSPADYPRVELADLGRKVEKADIAGFFIDFMKLDHLGVIATRHMILADQRELGTQDPDCLKLAQLHSDAVDFAKSGKFVELRELPRAAKYRPDFFAPGPEARILDKTHVELEEYVLETAPDEDEEAFESPRHQYYRSEKILGKLYRAVDEQKIWQEQIHRGRAQRPSSESSFWPQYLSTMTKRYEAVVPVTEHTAWVSRLTTARELREIYESNLSDSMHSHSEHPTKPISEIEVFVGQILNRSGVQTSRQRDSSIKLKDSFDRMAQWITKEMRSVRYDAETPLTGYQSKWDNLHLCLACVHVGGEDVGNLNGRYFGNLQSFRVVAACALNAEMNLFDGGGHVSGGYAGTGGGGYVGLRG